ncbi:NADP-dependent 3-hydroxy acid dehydrogenase YdfG [Pseudorhodobacter antarcticus]|jgi:NAD(P)-dependent dehydrogenase (short-subunit alcohol dehydrogenase family)|uniref:NADP-dependent 3-hydroxy acid dehydrogenase YdfG n=2 Tax=Pseudorhodobacter antarcticus TaxID=1077947 RepID=A0A1H8CB26_9RHOB|nr:NADP-dependent 3-hydroxy acid dehydrogenase YdfG [Pseudorhodobacter antarcticus]
MPRLITLCCAKGRFGWSLVKSWVSFGKIEKDTRMQGKVVAITGASRGIGAAAARVFADAGARVVLLARSAGQITELADDIGCGAMALPCDIGRADAVADAFAHIVTTCGGLDVLIGNAGVIDPIARIADTNPAAWSDAIDINLKGVFYGMHAAIPLMRGHGGTIITVSSGAAHNPLEGWSAYCAAKAGAAMLTRAAHLEEAAHGLRIMGLSPGTVATDMQVRIKASGINPVSALDPSVHIPADWPARALLWMCGPGGDAYLGQEIALRDDSIRRAVGLIP